LHDGPNCKKDEAESTLARSGKRVNAQSKPVGAHHGPFHRHLQWALGRTAKEVNYNSLLA